MEIKDRFSGIGIINEKPVPLNDTGFVRDLIT